MASEQQIENNSELSSECDSKNDYGEPEEFKKRQSYQLKVDLEQDDKAMEIKLCNFSRPHMRAFHCSWWGFFIAFFIWFAIAPLLSEIKKTLDLSNREIWTSSIASVLGTLIMRFLLGPACDKHGARVLFAVVLCVASIPTALTGLIHNATGLIILRLFIGIAGGSFVPCQYWTNCMFTREIVGTANALVGGWGNLGGGVTQIVMGSALFPLFKKFYGGDTEKAWRTVSIVPAAVAFATGAIIWFISDDLPKGNFTDVKKNGAIPEESASGTFRRGALNISTWLLFFQYACCFGVELTMNNAAEMYFHDEFQLTTESAAAVASIFGWMNLFARFVGGSLSDKGNALMGMRGRLVVQTALLPLSGALVAVFAHASSLAGAIIVLVIFAILVQAAQGSTYGIVPYVDPPITGAISGIVGAGGPTGAIVFGIGFRQLSYKNAFILMGSVVFASGFLSSFIRIKDHEGLKLGQGNQEVTKNMVNL